MAAAICAAVGFATASLAPAQLPSASPSKVRVANSGNSSEVRKKIPISGKSGRKPGVVMSMNPGELPSLHAGDRLLASAELQVTTDCLPRARRRGHHRRRGCAGRPYRYGPIVRAKLLLAGRGDATGGPGTVEIAPAKRIRCRQRPPDREHHCVIVFSWAPYSVDASLPCPETSCFVNLVASAHHRRSHPGDRLIIGGDEPRGRTKQDKGRINVVRERPTSTPPDASPASAGPETLVTEDRLSRLLPLERRTVVYSQPLQDLREGDQLAVRARMRTGISRLPRNAVINSRLILAEHPSSTTRGAVVQEVGDSNGVISEGNGFNCTEATTPCWTNKVGVMLISRTPPPGVLEDETLYVNLVAAAGALPGRNRAGRAVRALPNGGLEVVRYPAGLQG